MFLIFGWGKQTIKNHGSVNIYHCDHCNNDKHWVLHSKKTWFTLFFIPIIPYSVEYLMLCPICKYGVRLDKERFLKFKAIAECNIEYENKKIGKQEYVSRMKELTYIANAKSHADINFARKTETQLNYIKQMREFEEQSRRSM